MSDRTLQPWQKYALELADFIEKGEHEWGIHSTKTCFIGQAERLWQHEPHQNYLFYISRIYSAGAYGGDVPCELQMPHDGDPEHKDYWGRGKHNPRYSRARAVRVLRHYALTGVVDWDIGEPKNDRVDGSRQSLGHYRTWYARLLGMASEPVVAPEEDNLDRQDNVTSPQRRLEHV